MPPTEADLRAARLRVRGKHPGPYEADYRDGRGWVQVTREQYDAIVGPADLCPFCETDEEAEECPW